MISPEGCRRGHVRKRLGPARFHPSGENHAQATARHTRRVKSRGPDVCTQVERDRFVDGRIFDR
eukprot:scaffold68261_cov69-Phaeocystis_antarctica.AAC.1